MEVWEEIKVLNVSNTKFAKNLVLELKSGAAQQWIQERYEVCNYKRIHSVKAHLQPHPVHWIHT